MKRVLIGLAVVTGAFMAPVRAQAQDKDFVVIVNAFNPFVEIRADDLSRIFLKKTVTWSNGQAAQPVDQPEGSNLRRRFTARVLNRDTGSVKSYWQQQVFSGRAVPPPALDTDAAVLEFVRQHPYGVGYVSASTPLTNEVRVIAVVR
jgi:ABC-type phosphate transport system substrate-binding protein